MAINASIITDTAKEATKRAVVDYGAGVFAHTTQDWVKHNCVSVRLRNQFEAEGNASEIVATQSLRVLVTQDDGSVLGNDIAMLIPISPSGTSAITSSPPIIVQQPANKLQSPATQVQFLVAAISDIPLTYQWQKLNTTTSAWEDLTGKTANTLVIPIAETTDTGSYRVIVTNANGSTTSNTATLTISTGAGGSDGDAPFIESLPGVKLFRSIFG